MYNKTQKYLQEQGANIVKSAENKHYKRIKFLTCFLTGIICYVFSLNNSIADNMKWCHDGKFMRANGDDCDNCQYCTLEHFNEYFGTDASNKVLNEYYRYCPGFGDEDDTFFSVHESIEKDDEAMAKVTKLKNELKSKTVDCKQTQQFGVRSCTEFNTDTKFYQSVKTTSATSEGDKVPDEGVYYTCKLTEVKCDPGKYYKFPDKTCARDCTKRTAPVVCAGGIVAVDKDFNYLGDPVEGNIIPHQSRKFACECPSGFVPNTQSISVTIDGTNQTFGKGFVCIKESEKNKTTVDFANVMLADAACAARNGFDCSPGYYRPAGKSTCVSCDTPEFKSKYPGYACKGIKKGEDSGEGLTFCGRVYGRIPSKDRTECEKADTGNSQRYACNAGYMSWKGYNGADDNACVKCTEESIKEALKVLPKDMFPDQDVSKIFCSGNSNGFWQPRDYYGFPQGLDLCLPVNEGFPTYANSDHSACIRHSTGDTCPDGARGTYPDCECMYGGTMSKDETKCEKMTLTKDDLQYGPDGRNAKLHKQCWTKNKPADYKKCMLFDK